jgi:DNA-binding NtrC family response regulator
MLKTSDITILIVDDDEDLVEALIYNFNLEDFKSLSASGGRQAIDMIKNNKIDFVISDIRMPNGDGIFLLEFIKANNPSNLPILLLSAYTEITREEIKQMGAIDLLQKPADIDIIIGIIKKYCHCA